MSRPATCYQWHAMKRAAVAGLVVLYVVGSGLASFLDPTTTDLDLFFLPSAQVAAGGQPLHVYAVRQITNVAAYANANGPLSLMPLAVVSWLGAHLGWLGQIRWQHFLATAVFSIFTLLMAREGMFAIDRLRGRPLTGLGRVAAYAALAASPLLWLSLVGYGHIEQALEVGLVLFAVRGLVGRGHGRAGIALGLAILARTSAVAYVIPLGLLVLARRGPRKAAIMLTTAAITVSLGLLPFLVADRRNVVFSLVTSHGELPVGQGSFWRLTQATPFEPVPQHADSLFVLLAALVISAVVLLRRADLDVESADMYAFLAAVGVCLPLLSKTTWSYYFFEPGVFATVWWLAHPRWRSPFGWWPVAFLTGSAGLAEAATGTTDSIIGVGQSLLAGGLITAFLVLFGGRLAVRPTWFGPSARESARPEAALERDP